MLSYRANILHSSRAGSSTLCRPSIHRAVPSLQHAKESGHQHWKARCSVIAAAQKTFYDILEVKPSASVRDIKAAYRKKALKLHPDVNNAPDAQQRFMEAKAAFETLTDDAKRAEYDRRLRMGFGSSSSSSSWGSSSSSSSGRRGASSSGLNDFDDFINYGRQRAGQGKPEDNYTFDDLLRDLDKELNAWVSDKKAKGGKPKTLWEELEEIGGEFVDFLEDSLGVKEGEANKSKRDKDWDLDSYFDYKRPSSSSSSSASSGTSSSSVSSSSNASSGTSGSKTGASGSAGSSSGAQQRSTYSSSTSSSGAAAGRTNGSSSTSSSSGSKPPPKAADDDIDAQLAALKKKLGKT